LSRSDSRLRGVRARMSIDCFKLKSILTRLLLASTSSNFVIPRSEATRDL
jgi:hypothetical protein